ncbi:SnoaL-like domain-containing protein [Friedmanniella luteola]|uniref:SnoaL-like domain-containing protein n=1 Tax=Friedmanniella luteola TaxID=546871 RepID=A0A1H1RKV3_9ACTN|nr:nuclear transport factor 2 family protein [Friedmanniella luteola]SDS36417.1 SnoaL-like domain-containing protein [Friedmanniella luteola]
MTSGDLATRYLTEVSNERDPERRRKAIEGLFDEAIRYVDQDGPVDGREAFIRRIDDLAALMGPATLFSLKRPAQGVDDLLVFHWQLGTPDDDPVLGGSDVAIVRNGRITRLYAVLD